MEEGRLDDDDFVEIKSDAKKEQPYGEPDVKKPYEFKVPDKPAPKEPRYELMMGQLILAIMVGIFLALAAGYLLGKEIGVSRAISDLHVEKPEYCTIDKVGGELTVRCNELKNVTLYSLCTWISPDLKDRIRIMIISNP